MSRMRVFVLIAVILSVVGALAAVALWNRAERIGREAARRLQASDVKMTQLEQSLKQSQDQLRELIGRSAVLESKLAEAVGQQAQLERMYRNIAQDSLDAVLADVENSLSIASQQLLMGGNVQGALVALQDAEGRLKRADQPSVLGLRRLIARDLDRLKAVPVTDVTSLTLRLDNLASQIDQLPLLASLSPANAGPNPPGNPVTEDKSGSSIGRLADSGRRGWEALKTELQALFRVNRIDSPEAVLLAPEQQYFVRENLRLTMLAARLALLSRNDTLYRSDLERASGWLNTYFDRNNKAVVNAIATLRLMQATKVSVELPSLSESLASVRTARATREARP